MGWDAKNSGFFANSLAVFFWMYIVYPCADFYISFFYRQLQYIGWNYF